MSKEKGHELRKKTNLKHHYFGNDFCNSCVEEAAHGFTIDADWQDILPNCAQLLQLMDDLQSSKQMITQLITNDWMTS